MFQQLDALGQETVELVEGSLFDITGPKLIGRAKKLVDADGDLVLVELSLERGPAFRVDAVRAARNPPRMIRRCGWAIGQLSLGRNDGDGWDELAVWPRRAVAVGTGVASGPPQRSERAGLPHSALASSPKVETRGGPGMQDFVPG
jgi:hypothetical protein